MQAVFRVDASERIGSGHVMRCLTLADELHKHGLDVLFICRKFAGNLIEFIEEQKGFKVYSLPWPDNTTEPRKDLQPVHAPWLGVGWQQDAAETAAILKGETGSHWLIVDHYALDKKWYNVVRPYVRKIMAIDDLADRDLECDFLLDQTYGRKRDDYQSLIPPDCEMLLGTQYALLRPQFSHHRPAAKVRRETTEGVRRILVCMGGTDPDNITRIVLRGLEQVSWSQIPEVDVILGSKAPFLDEIQAISSNSALRIKVFVDVENMAECMLYADLAIGAGGGTAWERICLGLPTLIMITAANQQKVVESLVSNGAVISLGKSEKFDVELLCDRVQLFLGTDNGCRHIHRISLRAFSVCDGLGVQRVGEKIIKATDVLVLKKADQDDCRILFQWQSVPSVRKFCRNPESPVWVEHSKWFSKALKGCDCQLFIIMNLGRPIGMIRLDEIKGKQNTSEISILIAPECQGKGYAHKALCVVRELYPLLTLKAEVFPENRPSVQLFQSAGYKKIDETWYVNNPNNNWS